MKKILILIGSLYGCYLFCGGLEFNYLHWLMSNESLCSAMSAIAPWGIFLLLICVGGQMYSWARKRKSAAFAFGMAVQMFLPDPNVQKTIEIVTEQKKNFKQSQQDDSSK